MSAKRKRSRWDDEGATCKEAGNTKVTAKVKLEDGGRSAEGNATASTSDTSKGAYQPFKWGVKIKTEGDTESKAGSSKEVGGDRGDEWTKKKKEGGPGEKKKANFGLTGALAKDESSGNLRNGVVLKYSAALDAGVPPHVWRLYVFNGPELEETLYIHRQPSYLIGKDRRVSDIILGHSSCSKQHAVIVFRNVEITDKESGSALRVNKPYLLDLKSTNKTYLNGDEIDDSRYYELREQDCIRFGTGKWQYVLLHDNSAKQEIK